MARIPFASELDRLLVKQANLYRLQTEVDNLILGVANGAQFYLTEDLVKRLHKIAMDGLLDDAGEYRTNGVTIRNSPHIPPPSLEVRPHMAAMCDYVKKHWERDLVHLCAFVMWRLNWIHPFTNGNGRTARALSYLVLCSRHGELLPAKKTIIHQIVQNKQPYYQALTACDLGYKNSGGDLRCLQPLEQLVSHLLKEQLKAALVG